MTAAAHLAATAAHVARASWDAQCTAAVLATGTGQDAEVRCLPMTVGALRAVRDFRFPVRSGEALPLLLTALGGDVAATAATSLALAGVTPESLVVVAKSGPEGLAVRVVTRGCPPDAVADALTHVRAYSPIHRLLTATGDLRIARAGPVPETPIPTAEVTVTWSNGLFSRSDREMDEPRQLAGGDRAPSPLEYVLAALAAEAVRPTTEVHVSARRDLRGWFGTPNVPPEPRALLVQTATPDATPATGLIAHLIATPHHIDCTE